MKKSRVRNKEITSGKNKVYDVNVAEILYKKGKEYTAKKLSIMKQENIRDALESRGFALKTIKAACGRFCGYCFAFWSSAFCRSECPVFKRVDTLCFNLFEWRKMNAAKTKAEFKKAHKAWCKKIGLDVYGEDKKQK